jgi:hypothetical protein
MPKFTSNERRAIEGIVASLTIKRIPDNEIIRCLQPNKPEDKQTVSLQHQATNQERVCQMVFAAKRGAI